MPCARNTCTARRALATVKASRLPGSMGPPSAVETVALDQAHHRRRGAELAAEDEGFHRGFLSAGAGVVFDTEK